MDKGRGILPAPGRRALDVALYAGTTDGPRRVRGLAALVDDGRLGQAVCVGVRSDETPPELEAEADLLVDGPAGVRDLLVALAA
jgi:trehalose 6-phosphate phosphatase